MKVSKLIFSYTYKGLHKEYKALHCHGFKDSFPFTQRFFMALNLLTYQALSFSSVGRATSESSAIMAKSEKQYSDLRLLKVFYPFSPIILLSATIFQIFRFYDFRQHFYESRSVIRFFRFYLSIFLKSFTDYTILPILP